MASPLPDTAQHIHTAHISVRWGDMDAAGHINNSRFFTYFEEARVEWLNEQQGGLQSDGAFPVLAHTSCSFEHPVTHPTILVVDVYAEPPGETSVETHYHARIADSEQLVAHGSAALVWVDAETGAPVSVPELPV